MKREFPALQEQTFDLLVCGGGIYGAWTAYDAALRGLKVALVEQGDWAGATSSASSKLIHGGLRYLEILDFGLVRKSLAERQGLLRDAPHRVWPLRFGVPVYSASRLGALRLKAGLALYDHLAGVPDERMRHHHSGRAEFSGQFPFLDGAGLEGGFTYGDAQTDDARLVLELIAGAMAHGAVCVNYARLAGWVERQGRVGGATVQDALGDASVEVRARQCVSATGQWVGRDDMKRTWCRLSKGVHLVMPALPANEALLMTAKPDGRVFFLIPWYGRTLLGTTDTDHGGSPDHVAVEEADVEYLLAAANRYLKVAWTRRDVIGGFAGLRVMRQDGHTSPSAASRDWEMKTADNGLHYSIGGKLTSAREDAARIVDAVVEALGLDVPCPTRYRDFPWKPQQDFAIWQEGNGACARRLGIDDESSKWLMRRHGRRVAEVLRLAEERPRLVARIVPELPFILADLLFCARNEMAVHLPDLLRRRLPLLILARLCEDDLRRLAELVAPEMGWDEERIVREVEVCMEGNFRLTGSDA